MSYIRREYYHIPDTVLKECEIDYSSMLPSIFFFTFERHPGFSSGIIDEHFYYRQYMENSTILNYNCLFGDIL
jgi:hypothetical protein